MPNHPPRETSSASTWAMCVCGHSRVHHNFTGECAYGAGCPKGCKKFGPEQEPSAAKRGQTFFEMEPILPNRYFPPKDKP